MIVLVTGGRDYDDRNTLYKTLRAHSVTFLVHGDCKTGADKLARTWALERGIVQAKFEAPFTALGGKAGPQRNTAMLAMMRQVDLVLAFPGGKGTADMVKKAREAGVMVREIS